MVSGKLTHHKGVTDITSCIKRCCEHDKCHVAMMMADKCYTVFCTNKEYCQPKPAPVETHHTNPTVAYVKRGEISFGNIYTTKLTQGKHIEFKFHFFFNPNRQFCCLCCHSCRFFLGFHLHQMLPEKLSLTREVTIL